MNHLRYRLRLGGRPARLAAALTLATLTLFLAWPQPAPAQGTWSETGPLVTGRDQHTATLLADGRVLVTGGEDNSAAVLTSVELFNPATGTWSVTTPLSHASRIHTATRLLDGRVLVAGGTNNSTPLASAELFYPATGNWASPGPLSTPRVYHTATLLLDGRVLVVGGYNIVVFNVVILASTELFNPAMGNWASPGPLSTARYSHTATLLTDGRVLVAGGNDGVNTLDSAEIFNPADGIWSATGSMAQGRQSHKATLLADGRVLVDGGNDGVNTLDSAEIFNPADGTWSETGSLATARFAHTATLLPDGRVLAAGGEGLGGILASVEIFDPGTGTWSTHVSMLNARFFHTDTLLTDGRILAAGGYDGLNSAEVFDPQNYIRNGSFEKASVDPGGGSVALPANSTTINRWTVGDGGIDYRGGYWQPAEGRRSLDLNGTLGPGSIRQSFSTIEGKRYLVTFAMAGHPLGGAAVKTLRISATGQSQDFTFDTTGKTTNNMGWTTKSWVFTGKAEVTTLTFLSLTAGGYGPALDNVRVIQAPTLTPLSLLLE
jgi:choice-of-anchor C domain-containing protein